MSRTLKLTIAYDGTNYAGWQRQANALTIQQVIEDELAAIIGVARPLTAAGRTDAGVHAAAQVASVTIDHHITNDDLLRALNARIRGGDIRILSIDDVPQGFHARNHTRGKTYRYAIWNGPHPSPFVRHLVWHVPQALDVPRMQRAADALLGEQDFVAFQGSGSDVITTVRTVRSARVANLDRGDGVFLSAFDGAGAGGRLLLFEIEGSGFLRHMVRTIAGTLVDIGRGWMEPGEMRAIIDSKDRARAGQTAPAQGLMLWTVQY